MHVPIRSKMHSVRGWVSRLVLPVVLTVVLYAGAAALRAVGVCMNEKKG